MNKPPLWFTLLAVAALLWNVAGLFAILADLSLSTADIAALPKEQQAMYAARPAWSVMGSVVAVGAGTLGCIGLLVRRRWALWLFYGSLIGIVLQDVGLLVAAGSVQSLGTVPLVLQSIVLAIGIGLLVLTRKAIARAWLT